MKKSISLILVLVLLLSIITGCGQKSTVSEQSKETAKSSIATNETKQEKKTTVTVLVNNANWKSAYETIVANFSKKYSNITVEAQEIAGSSFDDMIKTKFAANQLPDFFQIWPNDLGKKLAMNGGTMDLSNVESKSKIVDKALEMMTIDKKVFGIPVSFTTTGLWYNKKFFKDSGIEAEPKNWNEFLQACEKLKGKNITPMIIPAASTFSAMIPAFGAGAQMNQKNPNFQKEVLSGTYNFDNSDFADIWKKVMLLQEKGYFNKDSLGLQTTQGLNDFSAGKSAMFVGGVWQYGTIKSSGIEFGFFPFPFNAPGEPQWTVANVEYGFTISANTKVPEEAKKLLNFFFEESSYNTLMDANGGFITMKDLKRDVVPQMNYAAPMILSNNTSWTFELQLPAGAWDDLKKFNQEVLGKAKTPEQLAKSFNESYKKSIKK